MECAVCGRTIVKGQEVSIGGGLFICSGRCEDEYDYMMYEDDLYYDEDDYGEDSWVYD